MHSLHQAAGLELLWRPRSLFAHVYDLVPAAETTPEPYATLTLVGAFVLSPRARCETADGSWAFSHRSFRRESVLVRTEEAGPPIAAFRRYWRRGVVRFVDGREFTWRPASFWGLEWRFEDANGTPLLRFRRRWSFPRARVGLEVESSAAAMPEIPCLACLGQYLLILARRRRAARAG